MRISWLGVGRVHPWGVFEGKCGSTGALFGSAGVFPPMTVDQNVVAEGVARISAALDEAKDYHVRVEASRTETSTVAVCGDLSD